LAAAFCALAAHALRSPITIAADNTGGVKCRDGKHAAERQKDATAARPDHGTDDR